MPEEITRHYAFIRFRNLINLEMVTSDVCLNLLIMMLFLLPIILLLMLILGHTALIMCE